MYVRADIKESQLALVKRHIAPGSGNDYGARTVLAIFAEIGIERAMAIMGADASWIAETDRRLRDLINNTDKTTGGV